MYTGAALSFGRILACRIGLVMYSIVLSDARGENDGSSTISERAQLRIPVLDTCFWHNTPGIWPLITNAVVKVYW